MLQMTDFPPEKQELCSIPSFFALSVGVATEKKQCIPETVSPAWIPENPFPPFRRTQDILTGNGHFTRMKIY